MICIDLPRINKPSTKFVPSTLHSVWNPQEIAVQTRTLDQIRTRKWFSFFWRHVHCWNAAPVSSWFIMRSKPTTTHFPPFTMILITNKNHSPFYTDHLLLTYSCPFMATPLVLFRIDGLPKKSFIRPSFRWSSRISQQKKRRKKKTGDFAHEPRIGSLPQKTSHHQWWDGTGRLFILDGFCVVVIFESCGKVDRSGRFSWMFSHLEEKDM